MGCILTPDSCSFRIAASWLRRNWDCSAWYARTKKAICGRIDSLEDGTGSSQWCADWTRLRQDVMSCQVVLQPKI